jgi:sugar lactone lactonase YvrE
LDSGTWLGTLTTIDGLDNVTVTGRRKRRFLTGTSTPVYPSNPAYDDDGQLSGTDNGSSVHVFLTTGNPINSVRLPTPRR